MDSCHWLRPGVRLRWYAAFTLLLVVQSLQAAEASMETEVRDLLARMVQALRTLDYRGTFVYVHGNQLEALEITHVVKDGQELERLVSLNGAAREVHRDHQAVTCVMPDARAVSIDERAQGSRLWPPLDTDLARLDGQYLLHPLGEFRVAGRGARVIGIIPKDKFRYGYRFYVDRETSLPLKTDLMNENGRPVEQIMFTSLELSPTGSVAGADPSNLDGFVELRRHAAEAQAPDRPKRWEFVGLPVGYTLHMHNRRVDDSGTRVDHFVLSDGLASVSVYVEAPPAEGLRGGAHVGAINAWGDLVQRHQVTAVGEVPEGTVRKIVESLRYRGKGVGG
jgi:sigma-E factor negative regulatory protein RseB